MNFDQILVERDRREHTIRDSVTMTWMSRHTPGEFDSTGLRDGGWARKKNRQNITSCKNIRETSIQKQVKSQTLDSVCPRAVITTPVAVNSVTVTSE
jgi:hypothetical protein